MDKTYTEVVDIGVVTYSSAGGDQSIDLTGGANTLDGGVEQTVNLTPGVTHLLSFYVGNTDNRSLLFFPTASSIEVFINGVSKGIFSNNDSTNNTTNWKQFSLTFSPDVPVNIVRFQNATPFGDNMAGLDDVFLGEVPEPATVALCGFALLAIGYLQRRKHQYSAPSLPAHCS